MRLLPETGECDAEHTLGPFLMGARRVGEEQLRDGGLEQAHYREAALCQRHVLWLPGSLPNHFLQAFSRERRQGLGFLFVCLYDCFFNLMAHAKVCKIRSLITLSPPGHRHGVSCVSAHCSGVQDRRDGREVSWDLTAHLERRRVL